MSPVKALQSSWAAVVALALCMWAQVPHSQYVFERIIVGGQEGWPFALGFEAAVLMFVVRNMHWASWFFAALSALINVKYYEMHGVNMWGGRLGDIWGHWLVALALPLVIAMYSHILVFVRLAVDEGLHVPAWLQDAKTWAQLWLMSWRQGKEEAQPEPLQDASPQVEDATLSPEVQEGEADDASPTQLDPRERAKQLRSEGLSNAQIARELQTHPSTVGRWLNGHNKQ